MKSSDSSNNYFNWHEERGYLPIINVSGTMTGLGSSVVAPQVRAEVDNAMAHFVLIHDLQVHASRIICQLTHAEAGFLTASASAGITLAVAATLTGCDPAKIEALPKSTGAKNKVVVQVGHLCHYGAPLSTAIELCGAQVHTFGQSTQATDHQLKAALNENTTAAVYVVSHHVVHYGQIPFRRFAEICNERQIPVIVDAASEIDLTSFIADGATIAIYSGHKFLGGPTSGIVAGQKEAVCAAYMQNMGIGRGMKIGKESIVGTIAAMEQWLRRDHKDIQRLELVSLKAWQAALDGAKGIRAQIVDDPTGNPIQRLEIRIDERETGANAAYFTHALSMRNPAIIVRNHELEAGIFQLDPCNLQPDESELVTAALSELMGATANRNDRKIIPCDTRNETVLAYLEWCDRV